MNSENVDYKATENIIYKFKSSLQQRNLLNNNIIKKSNIVSFKKPVQDLSQWSRLDDVIMGGQSYSNWNDVLNDDNDNNYARWSGTLITTGTI